MSIEREMLTMMFEGDLDLAKQFNRVGERFETRLHLNSAMKKLEQIEALEEPAASPSQIPQPKPIDI